MPIASLDLSSTPIAALPIASLDVTGTPIASLPIASLPIASLPIASLPIASLPIASLADRESPHCVPAGGRYPDCLVVSGWLARVDSDRFARCRGHADRQSADRLAADCVAADRQSPDRLAADCVVADRFARCHRHTDRVPDCRRHARDRCRSRVFAIASLPIASLPIASLPIASLPIASLPIASLPIASLPIASLPIASLDVAGTPIASLSTDGTLASVPIASLPIASLPIASLPIASLPIASLEAVVDCTSPALDCTSTEITLAEALRDAPIAGVTFETFAPLIAGLRWSEVLPFLGLSEAEFAGILVDLSNADGSTFTIGDALDFGDLTVGELPQTVLEQLFLGDLVDENGVSLLDGIRLGDLVDLIGPDGEFLDTAEVEAALTAAKDRLAATLGSLLDFGDLTLGEVDVVGEDGEPLLGELSLGDVAPFLTGLRLDDLLGVFPGLSESDVRAAFDQILANSSLTLDELLIGDLTFGDLFGSDEFGEVTLQSLIDAILGANPNALDGITLGDLLLAFVAPSDYPWDAIVFDEIDPADIAGVVGSVTFDSSFELTGTTRGQSVELTVTLPDTADYLPGTSALNGHRWPSPPWWATSSPGASPDSRPTPRTRCRSTCSRRSSSARRRSTSRLESSEYAGGTVTAASSVSVQQAFEPNNTPETAAPLAEDTIYINHVASADDLDYFKIVVTDGQRLVVNLSNLAADFDVVVYGRSQSSTIVPLVPPSGQSAGTPTPDPVITPDGTTQVQTELTGAATSFDGLPIVATGNRRGTETETVVTPPLEAGTVYVKVFGANGESSVRAAVLQAEVTEGTTVPECLPLTSGFAVGIPGTSSDPGQCEHVVPCQPGAPERPVPGLLHAGLRSSRRPCRFPERDRWADGADLGIVPGVLDVGADQRNRCRLRHLGRRAVQLGQGQRGRRRDHRRDHGAAHVERRRHRAHRRRRR